MTGVIESITTNRMTEKQLIKACLNHELAAQKQLYDSYAGQMMGVCYRYTKSVEDAEDVLQEGFIRVFTNLQQFKGDGELGAWIRRVMVNTALTYLKRHRRYESAMVFEANVMHVVADDDPEIKLNQKELAEQIRELPIGYQTVFNLYAIEGFNHIEIGNMLGISENTSRSQYSRARAMLTERLKKIDLTATKTVVHAG
jgi:RNA polymerase sigma factor (sigma-70 family)